jgi:hypothetical protein
MEDLSTRPAQEVLDDHLNLAENWGGEGGFERILEEDIRRNVSEEIVILINRGTFRGHEGVRQLAYMLGEELPEHRSFEYTYRVVEGRMAFLEWAYEDEDVRVRDGADSYLIENGKIVAQTIHYTVEQKTRLGSFRGPANFSERRTCELRRILLPRTPMNKEVVASPLASSRRPCPDATIRRRARVPWSGEPLTPDHRLRRSGPSLP